MNQTRREFGKLSVAALSLSQGLLLPGRAMAQAKPNSVVAGIQIGTMVPNSLRGIPVDLYAYRDALLKIGLSGCECHNEPFEMFAGAPIAPAPIFPAPAGAGGPAGGGRGGRSAPSPQQLAARKTQQEALTQWRLSAPADKFLQARKIWNDAGIQLYAFKIPLSLDMPDAEFDYAFNTARLLGAKSLTMELPADPALSARAGKFGEKHGMPVGYHAERPASPNYWDAALAQSPSNTLNLDVGHYVGAGNPDALAFIEKMHARISSMHLKDYKLGGGSMPWGEGDTPTIPILHLLREKQWGFPVTIELDYRVPENSTMPDEVAKCYAYIKSALLS